MSNVLEGPKSEIVISLAKISSEANEIMDASADLVRFYSLITDPGGKKRASVYIPEKLKFYALSLGAKLKSLDEYLSFLKSGRISEMGVALKEEIRNGQTLLKSISNQLQ